MTVDEGGVLGMLAKAAERRVRTPEGARHFGQPIGSVIRSGGVVGAVRRVVGKVDLTPEQKEGLNVLIAHPVNRKLSMAFATNAYQLYLVGGSVRDAMAGHPDFADLDYTTDATPEEIHRMVDPLGPTWAIGEEFGTVAVQVEGLKVEITTFRREEYDPASRNPVVVFGTNIEEDLARRDLTMNAMALAMTRGGGHQRGELVDPHGGARDLADLVLRTPDDPIKSMSEDPLRQLRVVRFAAKRGARVDDDLRDAIRALTDRLEIIAVERKTAELRKVMAGGPHTTVDAIRIGDDLDVTRHLFGGLATRNATEALARLGDDAGQDDQLAVLAAATARGGADPAKVMAAMTFSGEEIRPAVRAAQLAERLMDGGEAGDEVAARRFVRETDPDDLARAMRVSTTLAPRSRSQLSQKDWVYFAEGVMARKKQAGKKVKVPVGHRDDPEHQARLAPFLAYVKEAAASEGYNGYLHLAASDFILRHEAEEQGIEQIHGLVKNGQLIIVPEGGTNELTLLHEVAHVVTHTMEGDHGPDFARVAGDLYERYLGPEAAETFRGFMRMYEEGTPERTPLWRAVAGLVEDEEESARVRARLPVDGNDLVQLGLSGPDVGRALNRVTEAFLRDPDLTKEQALNVVVGDQPDTGLPEGGVVGVLERVAVEPSLSPVLTAPLRASVRDRLAMARAALPENSDDWFPEDLLRHFDGDWRRSDGSPGPKALEREVQIRALGKVVDAEVRRRVKAAGVKEPLTEAQHLRLRQQRDALWDTYDEEKWKYMEPTAQAMFGKSWHALTDLTSGGPDHELGQLIKRVHLDHPDLAEMRRQVDEMLARLVIPERPYRDAYATALEHVMGEVREMGGDLKFGLNMPSLTAKLTTDPSTLDPDVIGGPNSGVIPFHFRHQGPWDVRRPRPVLIDRVGLRDYDRLDQATQKRVRAAIRQLEQGKADVRGKQRGALAGTYGVDVGPDARMLIYPHVDGNWHIYAVLPHHDYREAERRMGGRERERVAAGPGVLGVMEEVVTDPRGPEVQQARAAMAAAARRYPASWVEASNNGKSFRLKRSATGRAYYREQVNPDAEDELALSNNLGSEEVAVHELAHRMERIVPAVRRAEWAFHWRRTSKVERYVTTEHWRSSPGSGEPPVLIDPGGEERMLLKDREALVRLQELVPGGGYQHWEFSRPDKYLSAYVGKDYGDGPFNSYEVLSMGMEGIWTGSQPIYKDNEHRQLVLGLLVGA